MMFSTSRAASLGPLDGAATSEGKLLAARGYRTLIPRPVGEQPHTRMALRRLQGRTEVLTGAI